MSQDAFKRRWKIHRKRQKNQLRFYLSDNVLNVIRDEENPLSPAFLWILIVVDESHWSISYNTYGEILIISMAITLGLTATPTDVIE
jgi:type I restriction enzyme R subunit